MLVVVFEFADRRRMDPEPGVSAFASLTKQAGALSPRAFGLCEGRDSMMPRARYLNPSTRNSNDRRVRDGAFTSHLFAKTKGAKRWATLECREG
jgi:hypothetical protein